MSLLGRSGVPQTCSRAVEPMAQLFIDCIREVAKPPAKNCRRHVGSWPIVLKKSVDVADHIFSASWGVSSALYPRTVQQTKGQFSFKSSRGNSIGAPDEQRDRAWYHHELHAG
jgi:hypothetical protein